MGIAREHARIILPQNMYTEFYGTVNLRNLLQFVKLRIAPEAQWEIRQYAKAILDILEETVPICLDAFKEKLDKMGMTYTYRESEGGHIWKNWRIYLSEWIPLLFK